MSDGENARRALREAPLSDDGWDVALRAMAHATGSTFGQLIALGGKGGPVANHISDMPADLLTAFDQAPARYSRENWRVASTAAPLVVVAEDDYDRARLNCETDWYDEACDRMHIPLGMQTVLAHDARSMIGLAVLRTRSDGRSGADERAVFRSLFPHALAGARLQTVLAGQAVTSTIDAFSAIDQAVFVLDRAGVVCGSSERAQDVLRRGLLRLRNGRLESARASDHRALRRATASVLAAAEGGYPERQMLWLGKEEGHDRARLCELLPLPLRSADYFGHLPRVIVRVLEPRPPEENARRLLIELLQLTPAEAEISLKILQGVPREVIAAERGTSVGTVAVQLKRVFEKADVRRETELVVLLNRLLG